jgi:predicted DNA binding protein
MTDDRRSLVRKLDHADTFPLIALQAARGLRAELDALESKAILRARAMGASLEDIAEAMGITRQGVSYRLKALGNVHGGDVVDLSTVEDRSGGQGGE